ncbi:MAG: UDP-2,3-diacylglucosamine diphosphatase LpxI [Proteobacteria bacterium]|nr:UDP-2,3-diacylglucosamine diphosphatase LpxI [Pseudomonadota bacterium]
MSLAIIAGKGDLPKMIIKKCQEQQRKFIVLLIKGEPSNEDFLQYDHHILHIGYVGKALQILKENQIQDIVLAGGITKPSMSNIKVDAKGAVLLSKITGAKLFGDDNVLKAVTNFFKKEGFNIIGADQIIDNLLTQKGVLGKVNPKKEFNEDIELGKNVIKAISKFDIGQSIVVQQNHVLGIEGVEGTDALINRCGALQLNNGRRAILVKMKKEGQSTKVDLPSLGEKTIENLHQNGFAGVALEAKSSLIINKEKVIELADKYGLFILGI